MTVRVMPPPAAGVGYDAVTRRLHWLNAILALVTVMLAWGIVAAPRHGNARQLLITLHGSCGIVVLALMLFWGGWRLRHAAPPLRPYVTAIEALLARATQWGLFALFVAMPLSGYASLAAAGRPVSLFGIVAIPPLLAESGRLSQAAFAAHLLGQFLVYGLVALHVAAAALHGFVRRDGILEWMLPRRGA
jgi:cytochrome b561